MFFGILFIILGLVLGWFTMNWFALYVPCGMLYALLTNMEWGKQVFTAVDKTPSQLYLWFATGIIVCLVLYKFGGERDHGISLASFTAGVIIAILYICFGLLMIPSTVPFVLETVFPALEWLTLRTGAIAAIPFLIILCALYW